MKKMQVFYVIVAVSLLFTACTTSQVSRFHDSEMDVAAAAPRSLQPAAVKEGVAMSTAPAVVEEVQNVPAVPIEKKDVGQFAESIRTLSASTESKLSKRALERVATHLDNVHVNKEKLGFFNNIKLKLFSKLMNRYMLKAANQMDTADILAIVSLAAGCVAIVGYFYASILFGVAAIATGVVAIKKGTSRRGMAVAGIILGAVGIFLWFLLFLLFFAAWAIL